MRGLGRVVWHKKARILGFTLFAAAAALLVVNSITPRYSSESRLLLESRENVFLRAEADKNVGDRSDMIDPEAVTSQIQLVLSRDLAREVIKKENLDRQSGIRSGWRAACRCCKSIIGSVRRRPRPERDVAGRAHARGLLRPAQRLRDREIARHRRRLSVRPIRISPPASPTRSPRPISAAADGEAGPDPRRQQLAGRRNREDAQEGRRRRSQSRGLSRQVQSVRRLQQHLAAEPAAHRNQFADRGRARAEGRSGGEGAAIARAHPLGQSDRIPPTSPIPNRCAG